MEFTLVYRGPLQASRENKREEKQSLRRCFHAQLRGLWNQPPLNGSRLLWNSTDPNFKAEGDIKQSIGAFVFAPLVCAKTYQVADLEIDLLRPGPLGLNKSHAGDIDNRLKVLLDALRMPQNRSELPNGDSPRDDERPFFCLLEDDSLIHDLAVRTHRWLEPGTDPEFVLLVMRVRTLAIRDMAFDPLGSWTV